MTLLADGTLVADPPIDPAAAAVVDPVVPVVVPDPVVAPPVVAAVDPATLTVAQLQEQLAAKDLEIVRIKDEKTTLQNNQALTAAETERLRTQMTEVIGARAALDAELSRQTTESASALASQQAATLQATETVTSIEADLKAERGRRVKSEIMLTEFPDLAAYADVIAPNEDPETIRKHCLAIRSANEKTMQTQRQVLATGAPPSQPVNPAPAAQTNVVDQARIRTYLAEGRQIGMDEYERRRKIVLEELGSIQPARPVAVS